MNKYTIIYPETHQHLGLFKDLENRTDVELIVTRRKKVSNWVLKFLEKVHTSSVVNKKIRLPKKDIWYEKIAINHTMKIKTHYIIIFDAAIKALDQKATNTLFQKPNVQGILILINSMNADSAGMIDVKSLMNRFKWTCIYSFDPKDVSFYGFRKIQYSYYSMVPIEQIITTSNLSIEEKKVYFIGGVKGNRETTLMNICQALINHNIRAEFEILLSGTKRLQKKKAIDGIHYFTGGWIEYKRILEKVIKSTCILEILQDGQSGPSLRYFEAVCYNKKLITNNPNIVNLPYYNNHYMKIIHNEADIDYDWILNDNECVNYHYAGDFSPTHLLEYISK